MKKTGKPFLFKILSTVTLFIGLGLFAQKPSLSIRLSKKTLATNQRLRIEYKINNQEADDFSLPNFKNFKVVGGPSQSISNSYSIINGKTERNFSKTLTYILEPKKKGTFSLPAASIMVGNKLIESNVVTVKVVDAIDLPKDPNDPSYIATQNVKMVTVVSKENPYVGEPVYVEYRLYVNQMSIRNYENDTPPNYEGFWSQVLKNENPQFKEGTYQGEPWQYAVLHKVLLIPQQAGNLSVNTMSSNMIVGVPTGRGDFWGNAITKNVQQKFSSPKRIINVKPLPTLGRPENFSGAVGNYKFTVNASRNTLKANESAQIKVKVTGKGNLKLFEIPEIVTPQELEVYEPERTEKVSTITTGLTGSIENAYTIVPQYKGTFNIPSTEFSYFNPADKKYHTLNTKEIVLKVTQGKELPISNTTGPTNNTLKQDVQTNGLNFKYIQNKTKLKPLNNKDFYKSVWFYVLLLLPLIILPLGIFTSKKQRELSKDTSRNKLKKADKLAKKYLATAKKELGNGGRFYEALEKALHNYLKAKLKIETTDISKDKIAEILTKKTIPQDIIKEFINVFAACEYARYGSSSDQKMNEHFNQAKQAIAQIDKNL